MTDTIIDLIRHGEPVGGRAYRGHGIDDPLSEKGWQQMRSSIEGNIPWQKIFSSPLRRCSEFAKEVSEKHGIPFRLEEQLKEVGFGCWEGRTPDEIKADNLEEYTAFYQDPVNNRPEGCEPLHVFTQRVIGAYEKIIETSQGQHTLIVAHAGVMRAIIAHTLHSEPLGLYRIKVQNAGITRIIHDQHGGHLVYHNAKLSDMK